MFLLSEFIVQKTLHPYECMFPSTSRRSRPGLYSITPVQCAPLPVGTDRDCPSPAGGTYSWPQNPIMSPKHVCWPCLVERSHCAVSSGSRPLWVVTLFPPFVASPLKTPVSAECFDNQLVFRSTHSLFSLGNNMEQNYGPLDHCR